jgi:hypothetical protein
MSTKRDSETFQINTLAVSVGIGLAEERQYLGNEFLTDSGISID